MGEVVKGLTMMLLFTIKKGPPPNGVRDARDMPATVNYTAYLNIVGIVVLVEPSDTFIQVSSQKGSNNVGVDEIKQLPEESKAEFITGLDPVIYYWVGDR